MEIILHLGAHRTATTSFQSYLRTHRDRFKPQGLGFWGPWRTRNGLLHGLGDRPESAAQVQRATARVHMALQAARRQGVRQLIVTDENMLGAPRRCLRLAQLYPGAGERVARLAQTFGHVRSIALQVRAQDLWWSSVMSYMIMRGMPLPDDTLLAEIAASSRTWRDVIIDLACACPEAEILVTPFERFADRPDCLLEMMIGKVDAPPAKPGQFWRNRHQDLAALRKTLADRGEDPGCLPEGGTRFMPFTDRQRAALREAYADDLFWLESGADGLAILKSDADPAHPRFLLDAGSQERGHRHDGPARSHVRKLARDC